MPAASSKLPAADDRSKNVFDSRYKVSTYARCIDQTAKNKMKRKEENDCSG